MDSLNWWTNSRQSRIILERKERILRHSLNYGTVLPGFYVNFDSNWQLWSATRWNWYQKWWNLRWLIPHSWQSWFQKINILKTVWATNNWSTLLDIARRVVLERISQRIRCRLHLLLFDNSCRKCEPRWYWPRPHSKKVKALFLRKKAFQKNWNAF
jgi:hypothetical protein